MHLRLRHKFRREGECCFVRRGADIWGRIRLAALRILLNTGPNANGISAPGAAKRYRVNELVPVAYVV